MNTNQLNGEWTELKGKIKARWAKFTDNDLELLNGNLEQLTGKIQKTYGYAVERAEQEFKDFKATLSAQSDETKQAQAVHVQK